MARPYAPTSPAALPRLIAPRSAARAGGPPPLPLPPRPTLSATTSSSRRWPSSTALSRTPRASVASCAAAAQRRCSTSSSESLDVSAFSCPRLSAARFASAAAAWLDSSCCKIWRAAHSVRRCQPGQAAGRRSNQKGGVVFTPGAHTTLPRQCRAHMACVRVTLHAMPRALNPRDPSHATPLYSAQADAWAQPACLVCGLAPGELPLGGSKRCFEPRRALFGGGQARLLLSGGCTQLLGFGLQHTALGFHADQLRRVPVLKLCHRLLVGGKQCTGLGAPTLQPSNLCRGTRDAARRIQNTPQTHTHTHTRGERGRQHQHGGSRRCSTPT